MKKWLALVVAALLALSTMVAFADVTPSKDTSDNTKIVDESIETSTGVAIADDFIAAIPEETPEKVNEVVKELFDTTTKGEDAIKYFPEDIQKAIEEKLPEGVTLSDLELNEIIALVIENYDEAYGDIDIVFAFNTLYKPEQTIFALLGNYTADKADEVEAEDGVEWTLLDAVGQEDGTVKVTFTQEALMAAEAADASMLAILNTK